MFGDSVEDAGVIVGVEDVGVEDVGVVVSSTINPFWPFLTKFFKAVLPNVNTGNPHEFASKAFKQNVSS